jgi:hypothetical protein
MNKVLVQPAGYAITIASWENDADFNATKTLSVANLQEAQIVVAIAKLFGSYWRNKTIRGETSFDNLYEPSVSELTAMCQAIAKIVGVYPLFQRLYGWSDEDFSMPTEQDFNEDESDAVEELHDAVFELLASLGLSGQQEGQYTRVAESITVHYYAEPVYAEDVTSTFN